MRGCNSSDFIKPRECNTRLSISLSTYDATVHGLPTNSSSNSSNASSTKSNTSNPVIERNLLNLKHRVAEQVALFLRREIDAYAPDPLLRIRLRRLAAAAAGLRHQPRRQTFPAVELQTEAPDLEAAASVVSKLTRMGGRIDCVFMFLAKKRAAESRAEEVVCGHQKTYR